MDELTHDVIESFDNIDAIRDTWDNFLIENSGPIYMSFDWCRTWWHHYGAGKQLVIMITYHNDKIVAILPMYVTSLGIPPFKLKVARIIGANNPPRVIEPPINKNCSLTVIESALLHLLSVKKCDVVSFGPLSDEYQPTYILREAEKHWPDMVSSVEYEEAGVYSYFSLHDTFEAYQQSISSKERKKYSYESRYLKKHFDIDCHCETKHDNIENEFTKFEEMHSKQWQVEGRPGHFKAWPNAKDFNLDLAKIFSEKGNLRLFKHSGIDCLIGYQYTLAFGNTYYWQLPARNIESKWNKYSLGSIGVIDMIKMAIEDGIKKIEAGIGHYDYKIKLGAQEHPVQVVRVMPKRFGSKFRLILFRKFYSLIDILYYKIWYRRLQPRLPAFFQRPIWKLWINLSF